MTTETMPVDLTRGSWYRAAARHNNPFGTVRRLEKQFERLRERYGRDATATPKALRRAAALFYLWDPYPGNQTTAKDQAERTIDCGSWIRAQELARAFGKHVDDLRAVTVAQDQDRRGNACIPSAINDCQLAARSLNDAWAAVRLGDLFTARRLRLDTAKYLRMVAMQLEGAA
jgi:hypothetical protein